MTFQRSIGLLFVLLLGLALVIQGCGVVRPNPAAASKSSASPEASQAASPAPTPNSASEEVIPSRASTPTADRPRAVAEAATTDAGTREAVADTSSVSAPLIPLAGGPAVGRHPTFRWLAWMVKRSG